MNTTPEVLDQATTEDTNNVVNPLDVSPEQVVERLSLIAEELIMYSAE